MVTWKYILQGFWKAAWLTNKVLYNLYDIYINQFVNAVANGFVNTVANGFVNVSGNTSI